MGYLTEYVDRAGILVRAKQPYYDWANKVDPTEPINIKDDPIKNVYLINADEIEIADEESEVVSKFCGNIFSEELSGFNDDETTWPADRSFEVFNQWFDWEILDMAFDILDEDELDEDENW